MFVNIWMRKLNRMVEAQFHLYDIDMAKFLLNAAEAAYELEVPKTKVLH